MGMGLLNGRNDQRPEDVRNSVMASGFRGAGAIFSWGAECVAVTVWQERTSTCWKFNSSPWKWMGQEDDPFLLGFPIFRGELLNFGGVWSLNALPIPIPIINGHCLKTSTFDGSRGWQWPMFHDISLFCFPCFFLATGCIKVRGKRSASSNWAFDKGSSCVSMVFHLHLVFLNDDDDDDDGDDVGLTCLGSRFRSFNLAS